jgi:hemolysin D
MKVNDSLDKPSGLAKRYAHAFQLAWNARASLAAPSRRQLENEFLPAALSLRDTPLHPAPRLAVFLIISLLLIGVGWASVGKVDVVASAEGKVAPKEDVKLIQAQDTAIITSIKVGNGERVSRGQLLLELDATDAATSAEHTIADLRAATTESERARAMLDAIENGKTPVFSSVIESDPDNAGEQGRILAGEYADYQSNRKELESDVDQAAANIGQSEAEISKLSRVLPIEQTKEDDYAKLIIPGYVGLHDYYNEQQAVIQLQQNLAEERAKLMQLRAARDSARRKLDAYIAQVRRQWLEKSTDDETKAAGLRQDLERSLQHKRLMQMLAPVDGVVQQLSVHTLGGVVTPAQTLMTVVPTHDDLVAEVAVDNQDIGFVHEGQDVEVKVQTFPFTRYGTLHGHIVQISNNAKEDESKRWTFPARVVLDQAFIIIDGRSVPLVPGMEVTAEIKTDRRRVLSYLLSPLIEQTSESMHER